MPKNESGEGLENQSDFETQIANLKLQVSRECGRCPKKPVCRIWKSANTLKGSLEGLNAGDQKDMFQDEAPVSPSMVILIVAHACRAFNG
jgi:hypothetical protein